MTHHIERQTVDHCHWPGTRLFACNLNKRDIAAIEREDGTPIYAEGPCRAAAPDTEIEYATIQEVGDRFFEEYEDDEAAWQASRVFPREESKHVPQLA